MIIFPKFNNPTGFNKIGKDIYIIYIFTKVANFSGFIKNWENNKRYIWSGFARPNGGILRYVGEREPLRKSK